MRYDAIIIGGGHNGLTTAAYLARAGRTVLVLERRSVVGGAAVTEEVFPGFRFSTCSYVVSLLRPAIIRELALARHGLELLPLDGTFTPLPDGDYLWRLDDPHATHRELSRHSTRDAEAYAAYEQCMSGIAGVLAPLLDRPPLDPARLSFGDAAAAARLAWRYRTLPPPDRRALAQLLTMSAADFITQRFETEALRATLAASGIIGTFLSVRSPGTAYVLLHHYLGEIDGVFRSWGLPRGGMGAVSAALAGAARDAGAEIRTDAAVARILVRANRTEGVVLQNGDEIRGGVVASSLDPRHTFLEMLEGTELPDRFAAAIRQYRFRGASAKVNLALDGLPEFTALPGFGAHLRGAISISPSLAYLETAYEEAAHGRFSSRPYLDVVIPSLTDPGLSPPGKHVMSCFVQYAPYEIADGGWDRQREALGDAVIDTLSEYAPNLPGLVRHRQVITPLDLEREWGLTEGQIFQGEMTLDQLFFNRPAPGWAHYRTPIAGLYQCGASTHPGGGVMGAPGRNAANAILSDARS